MRAAVEKGRLGIERLLSLLKLDREMDYLARRRDPLAKNRERARTKEAERAMRRLQRE